MSNDTSNEVVTIQEAETLLFRGIKSSGYSDAEASVMRDAMMWAQLRDNNQGIIKLTSGGLAKSGDGVATVELDSPTGARVNGHQANSMVVIDTAVAVAIEKARASGCAIVGTFNTSQSCGALGFYTEKIASAGFIGIVMATSPEFVAPHGARQPILGTNPLTVGVPTDRGLFLMDQATAAFPWFGLLEAKTAGIPIPEGVAFDADGKPTRDPNAALQGALRTFDRGYKSSNLALMVELLAGPLVGAAHLDKRAAKNWGNLVIALDPAMLGDAPTFYKSAAEVLERVRHAERLPGVNEIVIPGQKEAAKAARRRHEGRVPLERNMLQELRAMAAQWGQRAAEATQHAPSSAGGEGNGALPVDHSCRLYILLERRLERLEQSLTSSSTQLEELVVRQANLESLASSLSVRLHGGDGGVASTGGLRSETRAPRRRPLNGAFVGRHPHARR